MATTANGGGGHGSGGNGAAAPAPAPKAIRFVNNQGQPPQKRRRINAACLTCRKRKTRCDGEQPSCSTCTKHGHACGGYVDAVDHKRKADAIGSGFDVAAVDADDDDDDDDDYLDEKPVTDRRDWKAARPNPQPFEATNNSPGSSRGMSESSHTTVAGAAVRPKREAMDWEDHPTPGGRPGAVPRMRRPTNPRNPSNASYSTEDGRSPSIRSPVLQHHPHESHRVPYFRYFGPTAIVPGFKQMVVKVRNRRRSSMTATSPSSGATYAGFMSSAQSDYELAHADDLPVYDPNDPEPVHPIILHLVDTFFVNQGCNYPFLRREDFPRLVKEKQVEPILVDAVCALAARFSDKPIFAKWSDDNGSRADHGHVFAQRARAATVDTFPCPSVAAVQACLLMAYEGFGENQDSALWMYLGLAIRMAVDLGLHKKDGVKFRGEKDPWYARSYNRKANDGESSPSKPEDDDDTLSPLEQKKLEQERINTLWSVFILDRVISSGTGRPVTLRDDDFELDLPQPSTTTNGWPDPFPTLIKIIGVYGRVSDILNNVRGPSDVTRARLKQLEEEEAKLTEQYHEQDPRLRFDATNFQNHVANGQGTSFILLHFWFHALIIILHQPTLLTPLEKSRRSGLAPHSRELAMSSAKTIADILAFAKLIDEKSFIGNPFTSQPIYIAACAFLKESVASAWQPGSEDFATPSDPSNGAGSSSGPNRGAGPDSKSSNRHFLLASAANQNYQSCYKALQQMQIYWGGCRYILTALDQKSEGIWDCQTYTEEEYASTKVPRRNGVGRFPVKDEYHPASPTAPPLAWSLTGTTNSPNSSLTLLFQNPVTNAGAGVMTNAQAVPPASAPTPPGNMIYDPIRQSIPEPAGMFTGGPYPQPNTSALRHSIDPSHGGGGGDARRPSSASGKAAGFLRYDGTLGDELAVASPEPKYAMAAMGAPAVGMPSSSFVPAYDASGSYGPGASPSSTLGDMQPPPPASSSSMHHHGGGGQPPPAYAQPPHGGSNSSHGTPDTGSTTTTTTNNGGNHHHHHHNNNHAAMYANLSQAGGGLTSSGYSYLSTNGQGMHLVTFDNETDITQHLTSFESADMLSWFGQYLPSDVGLFADMTDAGGMG